MNYAMPVAQDDDPYVLAPYAETAPYNATVTDAIRTSDEALPNTVNVAGQLLTFCKRSSIKVELIADTRMSRVLCMRNMAVHHRLVSMFRFAADPKNYWAVEKAARLINEWDAKKRSETEFYFLNTVPARPIRIERSCTYSKKLENLVDEHFFRSEKSDEIEREFQEQIRLEQAEKNLDRALRRLTRVVPRAPGGEFSDSATQSHAA